jgi:N-acetylglutamate synthase-like GNAT family acetyltransferase
VTELREATPVDIPGIAAVVDEVWEQEILPDVCEAQIESDTATLWVATEGEDVVGFISAFLTAGQHGKRRWEVDLLAVRFASHGQRLGQKLVETICQDAKARSAHIARAAIRIDNVASQKTFRNAGFATDWEVHKLFLWIPAVEGPNIYSGDITFVPVDTVTYRGLWLEGLTSARASERERRSAVNMARSIIAWEGRLNTGAMIPASQEHRVPFDLREAATVHGKFYWFVKPVRKQTGQAI